MGKGDKRTRKGKIFAGSYGKTRPKRKSKPVAATAPVTAAPSEPAPKKPRIRKKVEEQAA